MNTTMNANNDNTENHHHDRDIIPDIPSAIDRDRFPVRNEDNASHAGGSVSEGGNGCDATDNETISSPYATSEQDDTDMSYDEGAEDHLIDVADFGFIPENEISRALEKQGRPSFLCGILPSPSASGFISPTSSIAVEISSSSDESSMAQSMTSSMLSQLSRGSSSLALTGHWLQDLSFARGLDFPVVYNPLRLTPETPFEYPIEIAIFENDLID